MKTPVPPAATAALTKATADSGFSMASDCKTRSLLRTPKMLFWNSEQEPACQRHGYWMVMNEASTLVSVDNDSALQSIAQEHLGQDVRVQFLAADGGLFLESLVGHEFDFIFAA